MLNAIGSALFPAVGLAALVIGADTLRYIGKDHVPSLSRMSQRRVSRHDEPVGFWLTIFAGLIWLGMGIFLVGIVSGSVLRLF